MEYPFKTASSCFALYKSEMVADQTVRYGSPTNRHRSVTFKVTLLPIVDLFSETPRNIS